MSRTYLTFGDIAGMHMLQIECTRCACKGRYSVAKLLAQHGHRGNMSKGVSDLRGDCMGFPSGRGPHPSTSLKKEPSCASQQIWVANGRDGSKPEFTASQHHWPLHLNQQTLAQAKPYTALRLSRGPRPIFV